MKRLFYLFFIYFISISVVFAQVPERLTIDEIKSDETFFRTTVNAIFIGCSIQMYSLEGLSYVIYERFIPYDGEYGEWDNWKITEKAPAYSFDISTYYDNMLLEYYLRPRRAKRFLLDGMETIWMMIIPNEYDSPLLWNEYGISYYVFYGVYKILP